MAPCARETFCESTRRTTIPRVANLVCINAFRQPRCLVWELAYRMQPCWAQAFAVEYVQRSRYGPGSEYTTKVSGGDQLATRGMWHGRPLGGGGFPANDG